MSNIYRAFAIMVFLFPGNNTPAFAGDAGGLPGLVLKLFHSDAEDPYAAGQDHEYEEALKRLRPLADKGNRAALYYLANFYYIGLAGIERDTENAQMMIIKSAKLGFPQAQFQLASDYEVGAINNKVDYERAIFWYTKSAESGFWMAAARLANAYRKSDLDLKPDMKKSEYWSSKATVYKPQVDELNDSSVAEPGGR